MLGNALDCGDIFNIVVGKPKMNMVKFITWATLDPLEVKCERKKMFSNKIFMRALWGYLFKVYNGYC